ncbi:MAG TPA: Uma2 family endonuclease [Frankiaceae bacterium]|nr:Uma2 family endonuclease [Frankiaceae bacterium]
MSVVTALPQQQPGRPFTRADLESMPDDGRRYELVDGCLLVTPAPSPLHQNAVGRLYRLLDDAAPPDMQVLFAPLDVVPAEDTAMQPDVLVGRRSAFTAKELAGAPLLAVEVLSRSTRSFDLGAKRERYERAGTPAYWVFDPTTVRLRAWDLREGEFVLVADVTGDEAYAAAVPFPVTVVPATLV